MFSVISRHEVLTNKINKTQKSVNYPFYSKEIMAVFYNQIIPNTNKIMLISIKKTESKKSTIQISLEFQEVDSSYYLLIKKEI